MERPDHFDNPLTNPRVGDDEEVEEEELELDELESGGDKPYVVDLDEDGNILREYTPEELKLRDKIQKLLFKFDTLNSRYMTTTEAQRVFKHLGMKPADVAALAEPATTAEVELLASYTGGKDKLADLNHHRRDHMTDIGIVSERLACMIEGVPLLSRGEPPAETSDGEAQPPPPKRRKSLEDIVDKYYHLSKENFRDVGLVQSILDARLKNITSGWRRRYCDNVQRRVWDFVQLLILCVFFVTGATYNASMRQTEPLGWWIVFLIFHFMWILDAVVCVSTACRNQDTGKLTENLRDVIWYRRWGLLVDLIGFIPVDMVLWWFVDNVHDDPQRFYAFLALRCVKCVKLLKIGFLFEIVNSDIITASDVTFFYQVVPIVRRAGISINIVHVLVLLVDHSHEVYRTYLEALMYTLSMVFGAGPSVMWDTTADFVVIMFLIVISIFVRGIIIGQIHVLLFEGDVESQNLAVMQGTVALLKHYDCSESLQQEILSFQRHLVSDDINHHLAVLQMLPDEMQNEVQTNMKTQALNCVPFLAPVSNDVKMDFAVYMQRRQAVPGQVLIELHQPQDRAFVIAHGSVDILGPTDAVVRTVDAPGFFGETGLLGIRNAPARFSARAVSYTDLWELQRSHFEEILLRHLDVVTAIEDYFGNSHPFLANLNNFFEEYVNKTTEVLETVKEQEEQKLARSTSQMSNRSAGKAATPPSLLTLTDQQRQSSLLPLATRSASGLLGVDTDNSRQGSTASALLVGTYSSTQSLLSPHLTTKKSSIANKWLTIMDKEKARQSSVTKIPQPVSGRQSPAGPAGQPEQPTPTAAVTPPTGATNSPQNSNTPPQTTITETRGKSLIRRWKGLVGTAVQAQRQLSQPSLAEAQGGDDDARPPQASSDNEFTPLPSAGPTPKGNASGTYPGVDRVASSHQLLETDFGGHVSLSRHSSVLSEKRRQLSSVTRPSTIVDEDTGSTASSGVPGATRQQREWMMTIENRLEVATAEIKDLISTVRHLQVALRDVMTIAKQQPSSKPPKAVPTGSASAPPLGANQAPGSFNSGGGRRIAIAPGAPGAGGSERFNSINPDQWYNDDNSSKARSEDDKTLEVSIKADGADAGGASKPAAFTVRAEIPAYDRPIRLTSIPTVFISSSQHEEVSSRASSSNTPTTTVRASNPLEGTQSRILDDPIPDPYATSVSESQQDDTAAAPPHFSISGAAEGSDRKSSNGTDRKSSNASSNLDAPVRKVQTMTYASGAFANGAVPSGATSSGDEEPTPYNPSLQPFRDVSALTPPQLYVKPLSAHGLSPLAASKSPPMGSPNPKEKPPKALLDAEGSPLSRRKTEAPMPPLVTLPEPMAVVVTAPTRSEAREQRAEARRLKLESAGHVVVIPPVKKKTTTTTTTSSKGTREVSSLVD